jgi:predicted glutamine amidotransferase
MCGIAGFIGESKNAHVTSELTTKLFAKCESRGTDAAGFWGAESGQKGRIFYHKEPIRSSQFVKSNDIWRQATRSPINLMLTHARGASKGMGHPHDNINNHPFVSTDMSLALIHNGRVEDYEYNTLKEKYEVISNCDSEILLRILEGGEDYSQAEIAELGDLENLHRMAGIKDIYSLINDGHMAVAVGERLKDGTRLLWLFRNRHRPLWISDMRETLGQIFFVSEPTIWEDSVYEMKPNKFFKKQKLIEIPEEEVWYIKIKPDEKIPSNVHRFQVCKESTDLEFNAKYRPLKVKENENKIVTRLGTKDKVTQLQAQVQAAKKSFFHDQSLEGHEDIEEFSIRDLEYKCRTLKRIIEGIETTTTNLVQQQSITRHDFDQLLSLLDQQKNDLQAIEDNLGYT